MEIRATKISGCYELSPIVFHKDYRGSFVKTFHKDVFSKHGLETNFVEEYYSVSVQNVLRGLHFQTPPADPNKLVYCPLGRIMDVIVDVRVGSPSYGQFEVFDLSAENGKMVYLEPGLAHGFYVLSETAMVMYKISQLYAPENDTGIRWDSVGIPWPSNNPILSQRDKEFLPLAEFKNPFVYTEKMAIV